MVKKWPTVQTMPSGLVSAQEAFAHRPCDVLKKSKIPWNRTQLVSMELVRYKSGVVLAVVDDEVVVLKGSASAAQEVLYYLFGLEMGVTCPKVRLVTKEDAEHEEIRQGVSALAKSSSVMYLLLRDELLNKPHILVMEPVLEAVALERVMVDPTSYSTFRRIGTIMSLDVLLHNHDRVPIGTVFANSGNAQNLLLTKAKDGMVFAIDNAFYSARDETLRKEFLTKVKTLVASQENLEQGLSMSIKFLLKSDDVDPRTLQALVGGFELGISRIRKHLTPQRIKQLYGKLLNSAPSMVEDNVHYWKEMIASVNIEHILNVRDILAKSSIEKSDMSMTASNVTFARIEGMDGLSKELERVANRLKQTGDNGDVILVFDFDRTLTNGFCPPDETALEKRIRGGQKTLDALQKLRDLAVPMYVVTARSPRVTVVQQLFASLRGPQHELGDILLPNNTVDKLNAQEIKFCGVELAHAQDAPLYASDYEKPAAVAHILGQLYPEGCNNHTISVTFFDDVFTNAHDVGMRTCKYLDQAGLSSLGQHVRIQAVWWDTFEEEFGPNPSMKPTFQKNTEQSYPDFARSLLTIHFDLPADEVDQRVEVIKAAEVASGFKDPVKAPKPPGKLAKASDQHENLAKFLFGGGKALTRRLSGNLKRLSSPKSKPNMD